MKKLLVNILFISIFIICLIGSAYTQDIPAPFAKAKEMALQIQPDYLGRYLLMFETQDTSYTVYIIGYLSNQMIIGVGKTINGNLVVAEYREQEKRFTIYIEGERREVTQEKAIEFAFQVFRELVTRKLI